MHHRVLVIGASGAGKTYAAKRLQELGIPAIDADDLGGLHIFVDSKGRKVEWPSDPSKVEDFLNHNSLLWDRKFLENYLKDKPAIYLFGLSENALKMLDLFDRVYFLDVPLSLIEERLKHPSRKNAMGKTEEQRKMVVDYAKRLKRRVKRIKSIRFIDASLSPKEIFGIIQK